VTQPAPNNSNEFLMHHVVPSPTVSMLSGAVDGRRASTSQGDHPGSVFEVDRVTCPLRRDQVWPRWSHRGVVSHASVDHRDHSKEFIETVGICFLQDCLVPAGRRLFIPPGNQSSLPLHGSQPRRNLSGGEEVPMVGCSTSAQPIVGPSNQRERMK
jgi:hypothetical protein